MPHCGYVYPVSTVMSLVNDHKIEVNLVLGQSLNKLFPPDEFERHNALEPGGASGLFIVKEKVAQAVCLEDGKGLIKAGTHLVLPLAAQTGRTDDEYPCYIKTSL